MQFRSAKALARVLKAFIVILALTAVGAPVGHAQQAPFAGLAGSWSGSGNITLSSGTKERIRCRATYHTDPAAVNLQIELRCASDSYKFQLKSSVSSDGGNIGGSWTESTSGAFGVVSGTINGSQIKVQASSPVFSAGFSLTTRGDRQAISITALGSEMTEVTISLSKTK